MEMKKKKIQDEFDIVVRFKDLSIPLKIGIITSWILGVIWLVAFILEGFAGII